jgi:uncharacterized protein (TIGR04255 family)
MVSVTVGASTTKLPSYERPPLVEVACSILFAPIEEFKSSHIGLLWQQYQPDYPACDDVAPLQPIIESFGSHIGQIQISNIPLLPRAWFITQDGSRIIQVQRDRFICNWRRTDKNSEYPRYSSLIRDFKSHLDTFQSFSNAAELGELLPLQYELTYVNQIPQGQVWASLADIDKIFPYAARSIQSSRLLPLTQSINWETVFDLPDKSGRLHVLVRSAQIGSKTDLFFELTARGIGSHSSLEGLRSWFDAAHEWIVCAFADLTDEGIQTNIWKRRG